MKMSSRFGLCCVVVMATTLLIWQGRHDAEAAKRPRFSATITSPAKKSVVGSPVQFTATIANGVAPYTYRWTFKKGTPSSHTTAGSFTENSIAVSYPPGKKKYTAKLVVTDSRKKKASFKVKFSVPTSSPPQQPGSINSTSAISPTTTPSPVSEQQKVNGIDFQTLAANDLGMHCGDLDHRVVSILPPFNAVHAQVIQKSNIPRILDGNAADVFYSAVSNPADPALQNPETIPVYKTNFWDLNPRQTGNSIAFDAYDPFYPPGILSSFTLTADFGLPAPDVERLYLGDGALAADQQKMPGVASPYASNEPQKFLRFDTDFPLFSTFPFGYVSNGVNWFSADGIPIAPFDDAGRQNSYPLMRVQSKAAVGSSLDVPEGTVLATVDTVLPVAAEADCYRCHASSKDGGNGAAACLPGVDAGCAAQGSPRSGTHFTVASAADDASTLPPDVKREWAADMNIIRLHDAKKGTNLEGSTPVVCQKCHYTPALDLAHVGPKGPDDPDGNGRDQKIHKTNSRVLHSFHGGMTDLFPDDMPPPNDPQRTNPATGAPVINAFVLDKLNETCYQCHPGRTTKCLRGAMFNGGLVCNDCHGGMQQVGDDFSANISATNPFLGGVDLNKRVPWAHEPGCQSCHTGDAINNLGLTDPNVIKASDNIRLLQAYRTTDKATAKPIVALNRRFAESQTPDGTQILYRFSKGHGGVFCEGCHGSTHAEWPVKPDSGQVIANDNLVALQAQGYSGKIMECSVCHVMNNIPLSLNGPHGLHPVGHQPWVNRHEDLVGALTLNSCRACHGVNGEGTVLSKTPIDRTLTAEGANKSFTAGAQIGCGHCHGNPMTGGGGD